MFEGYKTRFWNKDHYEYTEHPPDHVGLTSILAFWPDVIDDELIKKFYGYEDPDEFPRHELEWVYADILYAHAPRTDIGTVVGLKVRELWYQDWSVQHVLKIHYAIWRDMTIEVCKHPWLLERIAKDDNLPLEGQSILLVFQDKYDELEDITKQRYAWLKDLDNCLNKGGQLPDSFKSGVGQLGGTCWSPLGRIAYADLVAILCDKPEWITENTKKLEADHLKKNRWWFVQGIPFNTTYHPVNEVIRLTTADFREKMEEYFLDRFGRE